MHYWLKNCPVIGEKYYRYCGIAVMTCLSFFSSRVFSENYSDWSYNCTITINTSSAGLSGAVQNFPVLVRLTNSTFDFSKAKSNGTDIRFSNSGGTHLYYDIERFDNVNKVAELWVLVDNIAANSSSQYIKMYWGKADAPDSSKPAEVFKTTNNFSAVWHLNENPTGGSGCIKDRTGNANHGTPGNPNSSDLVDGLIGKALDFDSVDNDLVNAGSNPNLDNLDRLTISAWIRPKGWGGSGTSKYGRIIDKLDTTNNTGITFSTANTSATYGLSTFTFLRNRATDTTDVRAANNTITLNQWAYVTVAMDGDVSTKLYYNGVEASYLKQKK